MNDLIVSLDGNGIKASVLKNGDLRTSEKETDPQIYNQGLILQSEAFAGVLSGIADNLCEGKRSKHKLTFGVGFEQLVFKFVTVSKGSEDLNSKIIEEIKTKLDGILLEDLYFSYIKVAPFVYQFIGIKKAAMDGYLEVATLLGMELRAVLPWALMLPKYVGSNNSSIFVCQVGTKPVVVLSELGGIFFAGSYDAEKSPEEINKLIQKLSVYKRVKPIDKVYTFNYPDFQESSGFAVRKIDLPNSRTTDLTGYEVNLLTQYMLDLSPDVVNSQANLVNILPLPAVNKKVLAITPVGASVGAVLLALIVFSGGLGLLKIKNAKNINLSVGDTPQVLSENVVANETTTTIVENHPVVDLKKSDLSIRIENGSGINGIAAQTKTTLEKFGYKVDSIDTADLQRETTLLKIKKDKTQHKDMLSKDLAEKYPNIIVEDDLDMSLAYDVLLVVGGNVKTE